jgi:hypothetical protein
MGWGNASVDVEAKVGAHTVFHSGAGIDEALKAVLPRLIIATDMVLVDVGTVTVMGTEFVLLELVVVAAIFSVG